MWEENGMDKGNPCNHREDVQTTLEASVSVLKDEYNLYTGTMIILICLLTLNLGRTKEE